MSLNVNSSFCRRLGVVFICFQLVSAFSTHWCSVYRTVKYLTVKDRLQLPNLGWDNDYRGMFLWSSWVVSLNSFQDYTLDYTDHSVLNEHSLRAKFSSFLIYNKILNSCWFSTGSHMYENLPSCHHSLQEHRILKF